MVEKSGAEKDARRCFTGGWFEGTSIRTGEMISGEEGPRGRHIIYSMYHPLSSNFVPMGGVVHLGAGYCGSTRKAAQP